MDQAAGDLPCFSLSLFLLQSVDQLDGGEEPDALFVMLDGLHPECGGDMGLARAWAADEHDIVTGLDEVATMQLADQGLIDLAAGEVEAGQVSIGREAGGLELVGHGADLALGGLGLEQLREHRDGGLKGRGALLGQLVDGLGHAVHLEAAQHDDERSGGGIMTHGGSPLFGAGYRSARHRPWAHGPMSTPAAR